MIGDMGPSPTESAPTGSLYNNEWIVIDTRTVPFLWLFKHRVRESYRTFDNGSTWFAANGYVIKPGTELYANLRATLMDYGALPGPEVRPVVDSE